MATAEPSDYCLVDVHLAPGQTQRVRMGMDDPRSVRAAHRLVVTSTLEVAVVVTDYDTGRVVHTQSPCDVPVGAAAMVELGPASAALSARVAMVAGSTGDLPTLRETHELEAAGSVTPPDWAVTAEWHAAAGGTVIAHWVGAAGNYPIPADAIHYIPSPVVPIELDGPGMVTFSR